MTGNTFGFPRLFPSRIEDEESVPFVETGAGLHDIAPITTIPITGIKNNNFFFICQSLLPISNTDNHYDRINKLPIKCLGSYYNK
jgi:hypothetical protein